MGFRTNLANFIAPKAKNSASVPMGQEFLRFGNRRGMSPQDLLDSNVSDRDLYTGYNYAAIRKRANRVAQVAADGLRTDASKQLVDQAKASKTDLLHPYLELIDSSPSFSNSSFWSWISTYLDLKGVFYLLAVRAYAPGRTGDVQSFQLLNPYNVTKVMRQGSLEVAGYQEVRNGFQRDIPPQQIIEISELNPFDWDEAYSLLQAGKANSQVLLQAGRYTRSSLSNNVKSPGIISTGVVLEDSQFENFKSRIKNSADGEPLFANGAGVIDWKDMNVDLDKAALDKINAMGVEQTLAVTGLSKTMLGIEVSGVTRDTSKVQSDLFVTSEIMPRIQLIVDALNQDYRNNYPKDQASNEYRIWLDSPLGSDRAAELQDIEVRDSSYDLYVTLVNEGYKRDIAAKFAAGEIGLDELGEPTEEPKKPLDPAPTRVTVTEAPDAATPPAVEQAPPAANAHHDVLPAVRNAIDEPSQAVLNTQEASLRNAIVRIQTAIVTAVLNNVTKNAYDSTTDLLSAPDQQDYQRQLDEALSLFYGVVVPLYAGTVMNRRAAEFGRFGQFSLSGPVKQEIAAAAGKAASSHVDTIMGDLLKVVQEQALAGASQQEMVSAIHQEYRAISKTRAATIARTETNRAFTMAQYEADKQFLAQNDLTGRAFKQWIIRSDNPCPYCQALAAKGPIPFTTNFADLGDTLDGTYTRADGTTVVTKMPVTYEALEAGNAHPNCSCIYQLVVE